MARRAPFRQADATKAFKAAVAAGLKPSSCTIAADGSIKVEFADGARTAPNSPFDQWKATRDAR